MDVEDSLQEESRCPKGGHGNLPGNNFCNRCGSSLAQPTPAPSASLPAQRSSFANGPYQVKNLLWGGRHEGVSLGRGLRPHQDGSITGEKPRPSAVLAVVHGLLPPFQEGELVGRALLPLYAHRVLPTASPQQKIRPFIPTRGTTMASADFSRAFPHRCRRGSPTHARMTIGPPRLLPGYPTARALYPVPVRRGR